MMNVKWMILAILMIIGCNSAKHMTSVKPSFAPNPVVAHRGAWKKKQLPENSIASLKEAIALGCTGSEFDVRMTADDSLVINHDPAFHQLNIEKSTYQQLTAFTLSNGEKLPTLKEYLAAGLEQNQQTRLVLEIKPSDAGRARANQIVQKVVALVHAMRAQAMVVYISFDLEMLLQVRQLDPVAITQYLEGNQTPAQLDSNKINGADYHFSVFHLHPEWIQQAKDKQIILNAWTVNEATEMDWLLSKQFDFITTNEPELLFERLAQLKNNGNLFSTTFKK